MKNTTIFRKVTFKIPSPFTVLLGGILFIGLIIILFPVEILYTGTLYSWLYVELSLFFLFLGLLLGRGKLVFKNSKIDILLNIKTVKRIFILCLILTMFGMVLKVYDIFFVRGVSLLQGMMENREMLEESGSDIFGIISAITYPNILFLPFFYFVLKRLKSVNFILFSLFVLVVIFPVLNMVLLGSRSFLMIFILVNLFYMYILGYFNFKLKNMTFLVILFFLFFTVSGYIFDIRTTMIGLDAVNSTQTSVYAYFIPLNNSMLQILNTTRESIFYYPILGSINFFQYMAHGFFELLYLIDHFNLHHLYYGQQDFAVFVKFLDKILNIPFSFADNQKFLVRTGIYNTFFGPIYYDFGFYGIFITFLLGIIIGKINKTIIFKQNYLIIIIYSYMLLLLYFILVVNLITFAQGLYNLISFVIFYMIAKLIMKLKFKKIRIKEY
jgi:hypothetical protein